MFLKKFFGIFILLAIVFSPTNFLEAAPTVAVIPFADQSPRKGIITDSLVETVRANVEADIVQTGKFRSLTRTDIARLLDEIKFDHSGLVDPATAAKYGKMVGAQYLVLGTATILNTKGSYVAHLSLRMIEVETAEIFLAGRGEGKSKSDSFDALQNAADDALNGKRGMLTMLRGGK